MVVTSGAKTHAYIVTMRGAAPLRPGQPASSPRSLEPDSATAPASAYGQNSRQVLVPLRQARLSVRGLGARRRPGPPPASICASTAAAWGSQKVMSMARYSAMAADSSARACSGRPLFAYSVPRPRWQWARSGRIPNSSARARACR